MYYINNDITIVMRLLWLALCILLAACNEQETVPSPKFVGSQVCQGCHSAQYTEWLGSHHQLAMQKASQSTVLGQFPAPPLPHHQQQTQFTAAGTIIIEQQSLAPRYSFGLYPLQQYLVATERGALQALPQAWDSRSEAAGGQRWFHLYSDERISGPGDALHWASPSHNANHMCIECHTTGFQKRVSRDGLSFNSHWQELGVGCESCHGPAAAHLDWAQATSPDANIANKGFSQALAKAASFMRQSNKSEKPQLATISGSDNYHPQIEQCASCHSRRGRISDDAEIKSLYDNFMPALIDSELYHIDGQIKDEVFEYGSFMQSKMAHAGVTCSNCHNPHSAQLKIEGNGLCLQCHGDTYNQPQHTLHPLGSAGSQCIDCHMPIATYMKVDERRDHSLRVPRPDLSDKLGTPNACQQCHREDNSTLSQWQLAHYGSNWQQPHYGEVFWRAERGYPDSRKGLLALINSEQTAAMVKARALVLLGQLQAHPAIAAQALNSGQALQQLAVLSGPSNAAQLDGEQLLSLLETAANAVRFEALRLLSAQANYHKDSRYQATRKEYLASLHANADRAASHTALAQLLLNEGDQQQAISELQKAIALEPYYVPAVVNLTDIYRAQQQDDLATPYFEQALKLAADSADLQHAYGLWLVRQQKLPQAIRALKQAADLSERPYYRYVYALALQQQGDPRAALNELLMAAKSEYYDPNVLQAAAELAAGQQRFHAVNTVLTHWQQFDPEHPALKQIQQWLAAQ